MNDDIAMLREAAMHERLTAFLYVLIRDELPSGTIEAILRDHVNKAAAYLPYGHMRPLADYCSCELEAYARDIAHRLLGNERSAP